MALFIKGKRNSIATEFKKGQHWRPHSVFREFAYLHHEYVEKERSVTEIAKENKVHINAIFFWLNKHGIPRRSMSQTRKLKKWGAKGEANPMFGRLGPANPRWIDGSSTERQAMYARFAWKELIKAIFQRDNYHCVRCGAPQRTKARLHTHHLKPWAGNPESRFEPSNLITLCKPCHNWVHSKKNTDNEFILS